MSKQKRPSDLPKNHKAYVVNEIENTIQIVEGHEYPDAVYMEGSFAMLRALKAVIEPLDPSDPLIVALGSAVEKAVDESIDGYDCVVNPYHGGECDCDDCSAAIENADVEDDE